MHLNKSSSKLCILTASFGTALATSYVVNDLDAEILEISWNGGEENATAPFLNNIYQGQEIDQVENVTVSGGVVLPDFFQWNDSLNGSTLRTIGLVHPEFIELTGGVLSMAVVPFGTLIDPATFVGAQDKFGNPFLIGATEFDGTGSAFVAVRPRSAPGSLYWFKTEFGSLGTPIVYSDGQFGSKGESLLVGGNQVPCSHAQGDVNEDGAVDLLDVGPFVEILTNGLDSCEADVDQNGIVDLLDIEPLIELIIDN